MDYLNYGVMEHQFSISVLSGILTIIGSIIITICNLSYRKLIII